MFESNTFLGYHNNLETLLEIGNANKDMPPSNLGSKSLKELASYKHMGAIENDIQVYGTGTFSTFDVISGFVSDGNFQIITNVSGNRDDSLYDLDRLGDILYINDVDVSKPYAAQGYTVKLYEFLASKYIITSDKVQLNGGVLIWKSLARRGIVNVYRFDIKESEFRKYDGFNIPDEAIWGDHQEHHTLEDINIVLVASVRDLS